MYDFNGQIVQTEESNRLLEEFKKLYIDNDYPERILYINHLRKIYKIFSIEKLREISIPNKRNLVIYHERIKKVYRTNFADICQYVEQLEPWEDIDCLIFDDSFKWFLGINHSDEIFIYGF